LLAQSPTDSTQAYRYVVHFYFKRYKTFRIFLLDVKKTTDKNNVKARALKFYTWNFKYFANVCCKFHLDWEIKNEYN